MEARSNDATSRMAVLLHADVVGSTALVQRDERIAHGRITGALRSFSDVISSYGGVAHEVRGDALVAEFSRASDAVSAALAFQKSNEEKNRHLDDGIVPRIRVGISLGEAIFADSTVTGAGVVLAQRIEQLADPGGVCITEAVNEAVPRRLPFEYEALGESVLKGFQQQVHAHKVRLAPDGEIPPPEPRQVVARGVKALYLFVAILLLVSLGLYATKPWRPDTEPASVDRLAYELPDEPSIAVLPFRNLSGDPEQDHLADGFTEVIITSLSKTPELFVIARDSTDIYRGKSVSPRIVAEELGVRYVLEGSVQRADQRVRINTRLVDAISGDHVWAEHYDYAFNDLFEAQDDITHRIAVEMQVNLTLGDEARTRSIRATNPEIFELTQKAVWHFRKFSPEDNAKARELTEQALRIAPDDPFAMQMKAWNHYQMGRFGWGVNREENLRRAEELALRILELDENDPETYFLLSFLLPLRGELDEAIEMGRKAVALSPSHANAVAGLATNLAYAGRPEEAIPLLNKAMRLSPHHPLWFDSAMGLALMMKNQLDQAVVSLNKVIDGGILLSFTHARLSAIFVLKGDMERARQHATKVMELQPDFSIQDHAKALPYKHERDLMRELDALRLAGLPETPLQT